MRTTCRNYLCEDTAMNEDFDRTSRETRAQATVITDVAIFWGMISTVVVVVFAIVKNMLG